jgi:hypothetical protein
MAKPSIEECATYQRHVRVAMRSEQPVTVSLALEIAQDVIRAHELRESIKESESDDDND